MVAFACSHIIDRLIHALRSELYFAPRTFLKSCVPSDQKIHIQYDFTFRYVWQHSIHPVGPGMQIGLGSQIGIGTISHWGLRLLNASYWPPGRGKKSQVRPFFGPFLGTRPPPPRKDDYMRRTFLPFSHFWSHVHLSSSVQPEESYHHRSGCKRGLTKQIHLKLKHQLEIENVLSGNDSVLKKQKLDGASAYGKLEPTWLPGQNKNIYLRNF